MSRPAPEDREYFRLRAEWLRLKNHVHDTDTDLPTLPAVLDDVRRLMEERGALGLVYLDLAGSGPIEAFHGWQAYDEVVRAFAASLRTLRDERLLQSRDVIAMLAVRSDKFLLFVGGADSGPMQRDALEGLAGRLGGRLLELFSASLPAGSPWPLSFHQGHALMYRDPMMRAERTVHRALDAALSMALRSRAREEDRRIQSLDALIRAQQVVTLFQPILELRELRVVGHEVFSRGPAGASIEDPDVLFVLAERTGRLGELEELCRSRALASARRYLTGGGKLFLNTSAATLRDGQAAALAEEVEREGLSSRDVVLEITERVAGGERQPYQSALRDLKRHGFSIAIDDMGAGYASLQSVVEIEPEYLKFDVSLVHNIDRNLIKRSLLETLVELAGKLQAQVVAEGIEAESELDTLRQIGVPLGQGRLLAPPQPVPLERAGA
jgi:EAL domain-containing protein (putative c-di-GMP-specific phosphodiesterase class I)